MKTSDFDKKFDSGENITKHLDLVKIKRPGLAVKRINVDFPEWMIVLLDKEAERIGTTRQAIIKFWVADRLDHSLGQG